VECNGFDVNAKAAVVVLCDGAPSPQVAACASGLTTVAKAHNAASKASGEDEPSLIFFFAGANSGPVPQVKALCGLDGSAATAAGGSPAQLLLLDIPDDGGFYTQPMAAGATATAAEVAAEVEAFIAAYAAKSLARQQLRK
jgi:hypothetical protein